MAWVQSGRIWHRKDTITAGQTLIVAFEKNLPTVNIKPGTGGTATVLMSIGTIAEVLAGTADFYPLAHTKADASGVVLDSAPILGDRPRPQHITGLKITANTADCLFEGTQFDAPLLYWVGGA